MKLRVLQMALPCQRTMYDGTPSRCVSCVAVDIYIYSLNDIQGAFRLHPIRNLRFMRSAFAGPSVQALLASCVAWDVHQARLAGLLTEGIDGTWTAWLLFSRDSSSTASWPTCTCPRSKLCSCRPERASGGVSAVCRVEHVLLCRVLNLAVGLRCQHHRAALSPAHRDR